MVICLERGADLHMAQLMPLPLTVSCSSKIQIGFTFLVPAHPGSPGHKAVKRACVCVCCVGQVTLTLMGDGPTIPWRLLDINFLVEDPEIGDGQALVHCLQVNYIHQLVQSRLIDSDQPLDDLHTCLRTSQPAHVTHLCLLTLAFKKLAHTRLPSVGFRS